MAEQPPLTHVPALGCFGPRRQVLEAQMKADMADKEMLESSQSKYEEEVREKCSVISEQKAVRSQGVGAAAIWGMRPKRARCSAIGEAALAPTFCPDHQRHGLKDEQSGAENRRAVGGQQAGGQQQHLHPEEHVSSSPSRTAGPGPGSVGVFPAGKRRRK